MSNMSHCRFENTFKDLRDCLEAIDDAGGLTRLIESLNEYEKPYAKRLVSICSEIHENYGEASGE